MTLTTTDYSKIIPLTSFHYILDSKGLHIKKSGAIEISIPHGSVLTFDGADFENGLLLDIFNKIAEALDNMCSGGGTNPPGGNRIFTETFVETFV